MTTCKMPCQACGGAGKYKFNFAISINCPICHGKGYIKTTMKTKTKRVKRDRIIQISVLSNSDKILGLSESGTLYALTENGWEIPLKSPMLPEEEAV